MYADRKREDDVCVEHGEWEGYGNKETRICLSCRKQKKMFPNLKHEGIRSWKEGTGGRG
jgi:hypothetical protein